MTPRGFGSSRVRRVTLGLLASLPVLVVAAGCSKKTEQVTPASDVSVSLATRPPGTASLTARPGMVWIPPGLLKAGTHPNVAPRIADEELPGAPVQMGGYYIDLYPYPNEPGAIPTTAVSRDEAQKLCGAKGKRLCTELEWERSCKGNDNQTYEYGNGYQADVCGTGIAADRAARRPNGERSTCKSGFGVIDMHGGVWEWTDSSWARRTHDASVGVLRGGNAKSGELVGRCANALGRPVGTKQATIGFRCCAGPRNDAAVDFDVRDQQGLERRPDRELDALTAPLADITTTLWGSRETQASAYEYQRAWHWHPVGNEELLIALGCERRGGPWAHCGVVVTRVYEGKALLLAQFATGAHIPDIIAFDDDRRHLRARGMDIRGTFQRDFEYVYGRIKVTEEARP